MTFESDDIVDTGATENTAAEVETKQTEWQPESEAQEPEQEETEQKEESEQEEKPKRNRAQERIQQLAREKAEMAAKLAEYEAKANQPAQASEGPAIEDFEDYSEFKRLNESGSWMKLNANSVKKCWQRSSNKHR